MTTPHTFALTIAVSPGDIDEMGHVNNVHYLRWVQQVATAHWTAEAPAEDLERVGWVVLRHEIDYWRPALPGDTVFARTWVGSATRRPIASSSGTLRLTPNPPRGMTARVSRG